MSIFETVKKNGKTIFGVITGLTIAAGSLMVASSKKKELDDYEDVEVDFEEVNEIDEIDKESEKEEEVEE